MQTSIWSSIFSIVVFIFSLLVLYTVFKQSRKFKSTMRILSDNNKSIEQKEEMLKRHYR